ncbi:hypothetical protein RY27_15700, partial [Litorilinea aerophila]
LQFLRAMHLAGRLGREQEALTLLGELIRQDPMWREYLRREAQVDHCGYPGLGQRLLDALEP